MSKTLNIPPGSAIRVMREDGSYAYYVHRGAAVYEDGNGDKHNDVGLYMELAIKSGGAWNVLFP